MKKNLIEIKQVIIDLIVQMISSADCPIDGNQSLQSLGFDSLRLMSLVVSAEDKLCINLKDIYLTAAHLKTIESLVNAFFQSQDISAV